ncbi:hypothetical protein OQA88_1884 [Cercophora sp. LCS_1]
MPPTLDQILFPQAATANLSKLLGDLKRANLSIPNRLHSIRQDADFVAAVADILQLPLVANERCGSWYIPPRNKAASAYFKSTDGHTGEWKFSTRRLNLHLVDTIVRHHGCIIVDSTRRGKSMPDALSKTVPVWCATVNAALGIGNALFVPPNVVSGSEKSQMEARLPGFAKALLELNLPLDALRGKLDKPLRPVWVTREDDLDVVRECVEELGREWSPVVCCTSSRRMVGVDVEVEEGGYIQGAGDDTENWARGLTAEVFWKNEELLMGLGEGEVEEAIEGLMARREKGQSEVHELGWGLWVGELEAREKCVKEGACVAVLGKGAKAGEEDVGNERELKVPVGKGKLGSRDLRDKLGEVCQFVGAYLGKAGKEGKVVILCETGRDLSVGVALALACWCFDGEGNPRPEGGKEPLNKTAIRVKLGQIMTAMPNANPSRATLQSVNSFLMDWRK